MPGDPTALLVGYGPQTSGSAVMASATGAASPASHWGFIFWLIVIGVVLPAAILGGLQFGGFSFVFRHR